MSDVRPVKSGKPRGGGAPGGRPVSLVDVARLAGVSSGTVSRTLSKPDMISEATRVRVMDAVERLGYVVNGAARALVDRRTRTVGALVPRFGTSSFPTLVQTLESKLASAGYTMLLSAPEHARARDPNLIRTLLERGVDAVALLGTEYAPQTFSMLRSLRVPYVLMWASDSKEGACVGFDEHDAASQVVGHLADLGHRQIGFVGGFSADNERARRRLRGLREAVSSRGLTLQPAAIVETEYGFREGFKAARELMERGLPITAVVCGNDYLAAGVLSALSQAGIEVPGQISVASFNDNEFAAYLHPPLTTLRVPIGDIGTRSAEYLLTQLRGEPAAPVDKLPVQLMIRSSTGPAPLSPRSR